MIKKLVTIIIPCSNSLLELKSTIESLMFQTRIRGTRVLVADFGSSDGSIQYAQQLGFELRNSLVVEPFDFLKDKNDIYLSIDTPYVFCVLPGKILDDRDFIMDHLNKISRTGEPTIYTEETAFSRIVKRIRNRKTKNIGLMVKKENISDISFFEENQIPIIDLPRVKRKTVKI